MAVHTAPLLMNYFHNPDFIFANPFRFNDRFDGTRRFFSGDGRPSKTRSLEINFLSESDLRLGLETWVERGGGGTSMGFELSETPSVARPLISSPATIRSAIATAAAPIY